MANRNVKNETRATKKLNFSKLPPPLFLLAGMSVGWWTTQQSGIQKMTGSWWHTRIPFTIVTSLFQ